MEGFESQPDGAMIGQVILDSHPVGMAYERCVGFHKDFHRHDRPMFVFPRFGTRMTITTKHEQICYQLDESKVFYLPAGMIHNDLAQSKIYDTIALYPTKSFLEQLLGKLAKSYHSSSEDIVLDCPKMFSRSRLQTECIHNIIERFVARRAASSDVLSQYFETMLDDCISNLFQKSTVEDTDSDFAQSMKRYIEANLFQNFNNQDLVDYFGKSQPTLTKIFRGRYGVSPIQYIRTRRLQEASLLVKDQSLSLEDIAALVGYSDATVFSHAYKKEFGIAPRRGSQN